jgi:hypothetical protein
MADEGRGRELPQRARGADRAADRAAAPPSGSPPAPVPSAQLRQRLEAAVTAERSEAAAREQDRPAGGEVTIPSVKSETGGLGGIRRRGPVHEVQPRAANAGPITEDEVTEWLGTVGKSPSAAASPGAASPGAASPGAASPGTTSPGTTSPGATEAPPDAEPESASWLGAWIAALVVIPALVLGSLTVVAVRHLTGTRESGRPSAALARQEAAVRAGAAAWVAQQVSHGVTVSCDPVMCAALAARGFRERDLLVLGPVSLDPRHSAVVVETAAVRELFGSSLDRAWAPAVLASFGSGSAGITVRVIASHGAVAYQTALIGDFAAGKAAAARLLAVRRISVAASARAQLTTGLVDLRLLSALTALSRHLPVSLVDFGNVGEGANAGVPLRFADLSQTSPAAGLTRAAYVRSVRSALSGLDTRFRPVRAVPVVLPDGQAVLRVEFTAPSPFRLSGS